MARFVRWDQKVISSDKGRREVHFRMFDGAGKKVLAVVGKEASVRHMSYVVAGQFLETMAAAPALEFRRHRRMKWKSKREVVEWLNSIIDSTPQTPTLLNRFLEDEGGQPAMIQTPKGLSSGNMGHVFKEFSWLGACSWNSKKKRKHYRSFCRNGITISVHDFVYVMSEECKRLVAYVEDLYEDSKGFKMVVVRWFHKVDEVAFLLPPDVHDREIFFSLCLQDFSVECIDGVASVLSAHDFSKYQNEARHNGKGTWDPYLCRRQIDSEEVKPFNITQVQGYWSQELLRSMYAKTPGTSLKLRLKISNSKLRIDADKSGEKHGKPPAGPPLLRKELLKQKLQQQQKHLLPGCRIEVLSQDSGMRGCWFRCVVIKSRHDKVRVRYEDVQDADVAGNLEEWVLASRVSSPDQLGIRLSGRLVVRPDPSSIDNKLSFDPGVGSIVDAWWHDGWWEGIVIGKESEGKICVYFPGEQQVSTFILADLRQSQEWVDNKWTQIEPCPEIATSLRSDIYPKNQLDLLTVEPSISGEETEAEPITESPQSVLDQPTEGRKEARVPNLVQVCHLDSLNWTTSRKRRRGREISKGGRSSRSKRQCTSSGEISSSSGGEDADEESKCKDGFSLPVVEHDKCKIEGGDPVLVSPMSLCSSLVLSQ